MKSNNNAGNKPQTPLLDNSPASGSGLKRSAYVIGVVVLLLTALIVAWFTLKSVENRIRKQTVVGLEGVLESTHRAVVEIWVGHLFMDHALWAAEKITPELVEDTKKLLILSKNPDAILKSRALSDVRKHFKKSLELSGYKGIFIISPDYINVASMRDSNIGQTNIIIRERKTYLDHVFKGNYELIPPIRSDVPLPDSSGKLVDNYPTMFVAVPIRDNAGSVIAALAVRIDPFNNFTRIAQIGRFGQTGETYLFDDKARLITESRFNGHLREIGLLGKGDNGILSIEIRDPGVNMAEGYKPSIPKSDQPLTRMAESAIKNKGTGSSAKSYRDYRGVPVLGTWLWDDTLNIGFTTEVDEAEALEVYYYLRLITFGGISIAALLAFMILVIRRSRIRVKESEVYLQTIQDNAADAIIVISEDGIIESFNTAAEELFGYAREEVIGINVNILMSEPHRSRHDQYLARYVRTGEARILGGGREVEAKKKDGTVFPIRLALSQSFYGDRRVFTGIIHDLSDQMKTEEILMSATIEAEKASRAKSDFLARMSHEIRTPMNAIIGLGNLALMTELSPKQRDYLKKINTASHSLLGIINDILDFSKIEAGKLTVENTNFHLEEVLYNLSSIITLKTEEKGLELIYSISEKVPLALVGDPLRLGQVLINLVGNAVKFTNKGEILVSIDLPEPAPEAETNEDRIALRFIVKDTGTGMTKKQIGELFETFMQADGSTTRKYGGTGLGLAISKRLVQLMDGEITVESAYGRGSSFSFTIPMGVQEKDNRVFTPPVDMKRMKVLVVDDCKLSQRVLRETLESFTFNVTTVNSGKEAIVQLKTACTETWAKPFELVIIDWKMPGMNGVELSSKIHAATDISHVPSIIMVTNYGREEVMVQASNAGIEGFLIKPVGPSLLFNTIMEVLGKTPENPHKPYMEVAETRVFNQISGKKVLLVEDNDFNQQVAMELLEKAGLHVDIACNGEEAVSMVTTASDNKYYDIVLMDVQMPVMDGYEATKVIRTDERFNTLPIVAMTAQAMSGDREKCLDVGMDDYITKPIEPDELYASVLKWIRKKGRDSAPSEPQELKESSASAVVDTATDTTMEELQKLSGLSGIEIETGMKWLDGNINLYKKLLKKFRREYTDSASEIKEALDKNDIQGALLMAHSMKGVAGSIGAKEVYEAAGKLEAGIKEHGSDVHDSLLKTYSAALKKVTDSIGALGWDKANGNDHTGTPTPTEEPSQKLLKELDSALKTHKPKKCAPLIEQMKNTKWTPSLQEDIDQVVRHTEKFNFLEARTLLKKITKTYNTKD